MKEGGLKYWIVLCTWDFVHHQQGMNYVYPVEQYPVHLESWHLTTTSYIRFQSLNQSRRLMVVEACSSQHPVGSDSENSWLRSIYEGDPGCFLNDMHKNSVHAREYK